ncbi:MAG TPA: hypothetical protein VM889_00770 [Candidatus Thermoplasmatota archaeon]|nr:hypothetical protein [Candidatus Thermoplasmatota archaeon]
MRGALLLVATLSFAALSGCISAPGADADPASSDVPARSGPAWGVPIPEAIAGLKPVARALEVPIGAGLWVDGDHAYVSSLREGLTVVNVSDPAKPRVVATLKDVGGGTSLYARDADVAHVGDRTILVLAGQGQGLHVVDVTAPETPRYIATIDVKPNHNLAVHPTLPLVYNSASTGKGGQVDVVDLSNPDDPKVLGAFGTHGCHDITFHTSPEKERLYCAGVDVTEIWDLADPLKPTLIVTIENDAAKSYGLGLHHSAYATRNGTLLIIGDETWGGSGPGCGANTPAGSTFLGSLWFYDVTDEKKPVLLSNIAPSAPVGEYATGIVGGVDPSKPPSPFGVIGALSCTSHFGSFVPGHDMLVWGFYRAGVVLIDYSDAKRPVIVDQWSTGANVWDVKILNGYMFTGDLARGLDVLEFRAKV